MSHVSAFSLFSRLPSELQLIVFEHAFFSTPAVQELLATLNYSFTLYIFLFRWDLSEYLFRRNIIKGIGIGNALDGIFFTLKSGLPALLHACRNSREVVLKGWKATLCATLKPIPPEKKLNQYDTWQEEREESFNKHLLILDKAIEETSRIGTMSVLTQLSPPKAFPKFPQLPAELRLAIWRQAFEHCYVPRCVRREGPQRLLGLLQMMKLPLNLMSEVPNDDYRGGPYVDPRDRWDGIGLGDEVNGVHFTFKSGIPCLLHACRESRLVALEEWKSLVVLTADAWQDRENFQPWIHEGEYLYDRHLKVIDLEIGKTKRLGENSSTD